MPAYLIVEVDVTDPAQFEEYKKLSQVSFPIYGGRYLARGGTVVGFEGDWNPSRIVIAEFPDLAAARAWYDSPEYRAARAARAGAARVRMLVVEGLAPPV